MATYYAMELPINTNGGPEHVRRLVAGEQVDPANYWLPRPDGTKVVYHVCGGGPILLVMVSPGWGVGCNYLPNSFGPLIESGLVTVVVIQTRGTFPSEQPKDETQMGSRHMAEDIEVLRLHLGWQSLAVCGHSNAGAICLAFAQLFPSSCSGLILVDSQVIGFNNSERTIMDELMTRKDDPRYADAVKFFQEHEIPKIMVDPEANVTSDEQLTGLITGFLPLYFWDPPTSMPLFVQAFGELIVRYWAHVQQTKADTQPEADAMSGLGKITAQTIVFSGRFDWICSVEGSRAVVDGIGSHAEHVIFEECGHVPFIECPGKFFAKLIPFVEKLPAAKRL